MVTVHLDSHGQLTASWSVVRPGLVCYVCYVFDGGGNQVVTQAFCVAQNCTQSCGTTQLQ
jgi:hypothetical protein